MRVRQSTTLSKERRASSAGARNAPPRVDAEAANTGGPEAFAPRVTRDRVERESDQSFPASDPPSWIASWTS